jgi:Cupin-like domain
MATVARSRSMTSMDTPFTMPDPGVPRIPIERLDIDSEHAARHVAESRPFVARVDWRALEWTPDYLRAKVGDKRVTLRKRDGSSVEVTIAKFLDLVDHQHEAAAEYIMHNYPLMKIWGFDGPNPDLECLLADVRWPSFIARDQVKEIYVWARNAGWYDNKSHCEPNAAAAINLQIRGKKHVWLFPPEDAGLLGAASPRADMMDPPFFSAGQNVYRPSPDHPGFANVRCYEAVLEPGDAIHIPVFWYHWFVHDNLYQMNFNIWFGGPAIPVSPVAAEWSYMNALCLALGGFKDAKEKFFALPLETQELLCKIANTLVEDRRCTDVKQWQEAKRDAPKITIDPKLFDERSEIAGGEAGVLPGAIDSTSG